MEIAEIKKYKNTKKNTKNGWMFIGSLKMKGNVSKWIFGVWGQGVLKFISGWFLSPTPFSFLMIFFSSFFSKTIWIFGENVHRLTYREIF